MLFDFDIKNFFDSLFDTLNPGIAKFNYLSRISEYNVIVLAVKI